MAFMGFENGSHAMKGAPLLDLGQLSDGSVMKLAKLEVKFRSKAGGYNDGATLLEVMM